MTVHSQFALLKPTPEDTRAQRHSVHVSVSARARGEHRGPRGGGVREQAAKGLVSLRSRRLPAARIAHTQEPVTGWLVVVFNSSFRSHSTRPRSQAVLGRKLTPPGKGIGHEGIPKDTDGPSAQTRLFIAMRALRPRGQLWHEVACERCHGNLCLGVCHDPMIPCLECQRRSD